VILLAKEFVGLVPEGKISPAEEQNFLIARRKIPQKALAEVDELVLRQPLSQHAHIALGRQ
jgi:hypothetical protein